MSATQTTYIKTPIKPVSTKAAKRYDTNEFYKGKSVASILFGALSYIYTQHEVGILRTIVITAAVVWVLNQLVPFWFDLLKDLVASVF